MDGSGVVIRNENALLLPDSSQNMRGGHICNS